jgi:hypothetical protein
VVRHTPNQCTLWLKLQVWTPIHNSAETGIKNTSITQTACATVFKTAQSHSAHEAPSSNTSKDPGLWYHVMMWYNTNILEDLTAFTFRVFCFIFNFKYFTSPPTHTLNVYAEVCTLDLILWPAFHEILLSAQLQWHLLMIPSSLHAVWPTST